jgi:diguanylate cyclase (GGDEF)-like protein
MVKYSDDNHLSSLAFTKRISRLLLVCLTRITELKAGDQDLSDKFKEQSNQLVKVLVDNVDSPPGLVPELEQVFDELIVQKYFMDKERETAKEVFVAFTKLIYEMSQSSEKFDKTINEQIDVIKAAKNMSDILSAKDVVLGQAKKIQSQTDAMREELEESKRTTSKLTQLLEQVESKAMIDPLTQVFNRGTYNMEIAQMIKEFKRYKNPAALIIIDIDHFKTFNDDYGHKVGDAVLVLVASVIKGAVRDTDMVFRYGGEEFLVLLDNIDLKNALMVAEKVRAQIESHHLTNKANVLNVTVSIGLSCFKEGDVESSIFERADKALYKGKQNGRNRVEQLL